MNKCIDCGKKLKYRGTKRCSICNRKYLSGKNHPCWKGGYPKCIVCNKKIARHAKRCWDCYNKMRHKEKNKCVSCKKEVTKNSKRCRACWCKFRHKEHKCIDCGKKISRGAKRCFLCYKGEPNKCIDCKKNISWSAKRCKKCNYKYFHKNHLWYNWKGGPKHSNCIDCGKELIGYSVKKRCKKCQLEQLQLARKGTHLTEEHRRNIGLAQIGKKLTKEHRKKLSLSHIGHKHTDVQSRKILQSVCARPNKFETKALGYLNVVYSNKFRYTGDGSFIVNHRSADAYSKELNTIALFHGIYWHLKRYGLKITEENKRSVEKVDSLPFISAGYKVIFIWEDELVKLSTRIDEKVKSCP